MYNGNRKHHLYLLQLGNLQKAPTGIKNGPLSGVEHPIGSCHKGLGLLAHCCLAEAAAVT